MILNVGCGQDTFGDIRMDLFRTQATNVLGDAVHLPFAGEAFTEVFEKNLLEHMPNPATHLEDVRRVLKEGGTLHLITDNAACLKYYTLGTHTGGYNKHGGKDVHYALFTREHIQNLMSYAGFSVKKMELIDTDYFTRPFDKFVRLFRPGLSYPRIKLEAVKT